MTSAPWSNGPVTLHTGHVLEVLRGLPAESVQCVVTSPPYWGLRDYGLAPVVWDAEPGCEHEWGIAQAPASLLGLGGNTNGQYGGGVVDPGKVYAPTAAPAGSAFCLRCGAWRGSLGLEPTPQLYVQHLLAVFREVRRVLRSDGVALINLGDSYMGSGGAHKPEHANPGLSRSSERGGVPHDVRNDNDGKGQQANTLSRQLQLKPKDMVGIPWRVALALQEDGWWLRSDIIWAKPNPMPESVTDRPTRSHEYIFLLTKSERYYWDQEAVRESPTESTLTRVSLAASRQGEKQSRRAVTDQADGYKRSREARVSADTFQDGRDHLVVPPHPNGRNLRSVWTIATQPYSGAHFATFPEALVERCVLAGTSERGCCPECGAPWERVVGPREEALPASWKGSAFDDGRNLLVHPNVGKRPARGSGNKERKIANGSEGGRLNTHMGSSIPWAPTTRATAEWRPTCAHADLTPMPCLVLDPFSGAGTVAVVAQKLGRRAIGVDLSPQYTALAVKRLEEVPLPLGGG